ncbi:MAG: HNH endonuclease [Phage NG54]|nr:MAG: HNH endonuclease [Phage NG54]
MIKHNQFYFATVITMMPIPLQGKASWNRGNQDNNY